MKVSRFRSGDATLPLRLRLRDKLLCWREWMRGAPLPPAGMMFLVQGNYDVGHFVAGGRRAFETIAETLEKSDLSLERFSTVLDFGCGCGRVLRYWHPYRHAIQLHGTDYNPELVAAARRAVPSATIAHNQLEPPLAYADDMFDFVYAFSTFTHWGIALQHAWMRELQRVLRPNGYLLFTTHGDYYLPRLSPEQQAAFRAGRAVEPTLEAPPVGTNHYGSYNPFEQVRDELLEGMELVEFYRRASRGTPWQDVYLARNPPR